MNPRHEEELRKLLEIRAMYAARNGANQIASNPQQHRPNPSNPDPMIYPGLYSPSGFDVLSILVRVQSRPNPQYHIGNIDSSIALVLCDRSLPDNPIVYCSEPFEILTGYSQKEIVGRNCRFLQHSFETVQAVGDANVNDSSASPSNPQHPSNDPNIHAKRTIKKTIELGLESQTTLINYRKNGEMFWNLLTTVPVDWTNNDGVEKHYIVGFQIMTAQSKLG